MLNMKQSHFTFPSFLPFWRSISRWRQPRYRPTPSQVGRNAECEAKGSTQESSWQVRQVFFFRVLRVGQVQTCHTSLPNGRHRSQVCMRLKPIPTPLPKANIIVVMLTDHSLTQDKFILMLRFLSLATRIPSVKKVQYVKMSEGAEVTEKR